MKPKSIYFLVIITIFFLIQPILYSQSPVPQGAKVEKVSGGFIFVEGPVWKEGFGLLFSDMRSANTIYKWTQESGAVVYLKPSGVSNGLAYDKAGNLVMAQTEYRRIARLEKDGTQTILASLYTNKKLNSPNDLVIKSDGSIFFTDPDFDIPSGQSKELSHKGIYRISPKGTLTLLDSTFNKPNGICFSPDEKKLYVNESPKCIIYVWDVLNDSTITNKRQFYKIPQNGYADGMKTDSQGNVYCTGPGGVWIVSPDGVYLDKINTPETPTNCNWGEADGKTLFITAKTSVYKIRLTTADIEEQGNTQDLKKH